MGDRRADLLPDLLGLALQCLDVGMLFHQQFVLLREPLGAIVGGLDVDLTPLRELLAHSA